MRRAFLGWVVFLGALSGCKGAGERGPLPAVANVAGAAKPAGAQIDGAKKYPRRWTDRLSLASVAAIPAAMAEKLKPNDAWLKLYGTDETPPGKPDAVTVEDCTQFFVALEDGYAPGSTFEITQASFFEARCTPLHFLQQSWDAQSSWVSDLRLDEGPLALLPASMNLDMEGPSDEDEARITKGERLGTYSPRLTVKSRGAITVVIEDPETQVASTIDIVAWGDLDHDGIEDVLLFQAMHSLEGSFRAYSHVVLTRKGPGAPLVELRRL